MIEYKNVALRYTEKDVLRDVNLQIDISQDILFCIA